MQSVDSTTLVATSVILSFDSRNAVCWMRFLLTQLQCFWVATIYIDKAVCPSVCLSVRRVDISAVSAWIDIKFA